MNPGKVVYREDDPTDIREHLRYGPEYASLEPRTTLDFDDEGGFSHLVELCNGCGTCRQTDGDVMCPTYRATEEEVATTRGRANLLRAAISGEIEPEELYGERFQEEVLDLCIGCKGCQSDCPTGVDLAKLKAEVKHQYHDREGRATGSGCSRTSTGWRRWGARSRRWRTAPRNCQVRGRPSRRRPESRPIGRYRRFDGSHWSTGSSREVPKEPRKRE